MFSKIITGMVKSLITFTNDYDIIEAKELATLKNVKSKLENSQFMLTELKKTVEEKDEKIATLSSLANDFDSQSAERYSKVTELQDSLRRMTDERDTAQENMNNLMEDIKTATALSEKLKEEMAKWKSFLKIYKNA